MASILQFEAVELSSPVASSPGGGRRSAFTSVSAQTTRWSAAASPSIGAMGEKGPRLMGPTASASRDAGGRKQPRCAEKGPEIPCAGAIPTLSTTIPSASRIRPSCSASKTGEESTGVAGARCWGRHAIQRLTIERDAAAGHDHPTLPICGAQNQLPKGRSNGRHSRS